MTDTPNPTPPATTPATIPLAHAAAMPAPQGGALPTALEWQNLDRMAHQLADSDLIPYRLKRKPADVAVILLAAREYGIPPIQALSKLPVVNGTPAPMGELMVALVFRAGHYIAADFRDPDGNVYAGGPLTLGHYGEARYKRRDWTEVETMRFTIAEAVQAGLMTLDGDGRPHATDAKNQPLPWQLYTPNMARWRAVANACRLAFADVLMGLSYLPEELGAVVDENGEPIPVRTVDVRSIEDRQAQEVADRLGEQEWPVETLRAVLDRATTDGYLDHAVTVGSTTRALRGMLLDALEAAEAAARKAAAEAAVAAATAPEQPEAPQEQPEAPQEPAVTENAPETAPETPDGAHPHAGLVVEKIGALATFEDAQELLTRIGSADPDLLDLEVDVDGVVDTVRGHITGLASSLPNREPAAS